MGGSSHFKGHRYHYKPGWSRLDCTYEHWQRVVDYSTLAYSWQGGRRVWVSTHLWLAHPHRFLLWVSHSIFRNFTVIRNFRYFDLLKLFQPHNMPKSSKYTESDLLKVCEAAQA
jgi:hypothetical protein